MGCKELSVNILFSPSFIDRFVRSTFPSLQKVTLKNSISVYISAIDRENKTSKSLLVANNIFTVTESPTHGKIFVALQTLTPQRSYSYVLVICKAAGPQINISKPLAWRRAQLAAAQGVAIILSLVRLYVLVTNFSNKPVQLLKMTVTAYGAEYPTLRTPPSGPAGPVTDKYDINRFYELTEKK